MKRLICLVLIVVMSFALCTAAFASAVLYGDANGDGKINARDVIAMMRHIVNKDYTIDLRAANVLVSLLDDDFDEPEINARDVIMLMKYLTGAKLALGKAILTSIPSADSFSDKEFEPRISPIVRIKSATLYKNGTVTEFAPDDPKIIRLINFISYPDRDMYLNTETEGMFSDKEIEKIRNKDFRMEIEVDNPNEYGNQMYIFDPAYQFDLLVIVGGMVVEYSYAEDAEEFWGPGYTHFSCGYEPYEELGTYNILEWCGF